MTPPSGIAPVPGTAEPDVLLPLVAEAAADVALATSPERAVDTVLTHIARLPGVRTAVLDPEPAATAAQPSEQTLDCPVAWDQRVHRLVTYGEPAIARPPVRWALESLISLLTAALRPVPAPLSSARQEPPAGRPAQAVVSIDETGLVTEFDAGAEALFGFTAEHARGRAVSELIIPERLRAAHRAGFRRYLETGEQRILDQRFELPALRADGSELTVELTVSEVRGDARGFTAVLREAVSGHGVQGELLLSERFHRTLVDHSPVMITVLDANGRWRASGAAATRLLGRALGSTRDLLEVIHPDDRRPARAFFAGVVSGRDDRGGPPGAVDIRVRGGDDTWHVLHTAGANLLGDPSVHGVVLYSTDVTAARRAEQRVRVERGRLRALLDTLHAGILLLDEQRNIVVVNETFTRMFGLDPAPERLTGAPLQQGAELLQGLYAEPAGVFADMEALLTGREPAIGEEITLADGRIVERDAVPITVDGAPAGALLHFRDVTDRALARRTVEEQNLALAELSALKNQFVASVSHELRTPLTSIVSFSEMLCEDDGEALTAEQRDFLEIINRNAHRLHRLVGDLLLIAKLETRSLPLAEADVDVAAVVEAATADQGHAAEAGGIALAAKIPPGPPLTGDAVRLQQVVGNLLSNAVRFTPPGGSATVTGEWDAEGWTLRVADSGVGISEEDRARLFTPFFRSFRARERNIPGTGLGLVICRALVEAHGGRLSIDDAEPAGTVVTVWLPFDRVPADPVAGRAAAVLGEEVR
jgi:PAS domain S-box-containing protein